MPVLPSLATQVRGLDIPERLARAVEELQQFLRVRGGLLPGTDKLDQYISRRDLVEWGFATSDSTAVPSSGGVGIPVPIPGPTEEAPDYTPPSVPTGVTALGGYTSIFVSWDPVVDRRIGYFEVWRSSTNSVGTAVKIGQTTSFLYIDEVQNSATHYYWVRSVNAWDNAVTSAFNAVGGETATTEPDVAYALAILTGGLGEQPFYEITENTVVGDFTFTPGVYIKAAYMQKAVADVFVAGFAVIDDASIKDLSAGKITSDALAVGQYIESQNYVANTSGWRINADGTAEFSGVVARGTVVASAGAIGGIAIGSTYLASGNYAAGSAGFRLNTDGSAEFNDVEVRGHIEADTGYFKGAAFGGAYTASYAWPNPNAGGFHLSASGLMLGTWNGTSGTYAYISATGAAGFTNIYARGDIEATTINASAANIVSTLNIAGNAVTIPASARFTDTRNDGLYTDTYVPPDYW